MIGRSCTARKRFRLPVLTVDRLTTFTDHRRAHTQQKRVFDDQRRGRSLRKLVRRPARGREAAGSALNPLRANLTDSLDSTPGPAAREHRRPRPRPFVGGHIRRDTPVPIPNTVVKPAEPMILPQRESRSPPALNMQSPGAPKVPGLLHFAATIGKRRAPLPPEAGSCDVG